MGFDRRRLSLNGLGTLLGVTVLGTLFLFPAPLGAQEETQEPLVILTSLEPVQDGKAWVIKVAGKAPRVPRGTKIEFHLTWRGHTIDVFNVVTSSVSFKEEFRTRKAPISSGDFFFRTIIDLDHQKSSIKKEIKGNPKVFHPR